jgi:prepilin-type N-terminal cleavage/methylation domain-containing protein
MRRQRTLTGFTLIELLVCLGIIAMVSVLVAAQFRTPREEKLALAARQIMGELITTQNRAIADHRTRIAKFDPVAETRGLAPAGQVANLSVATVNFDGQSAIAFDELGMPYSYCPLTHKLAPLSDGSVVVRCGSNQLTVRVLPFTGQIQVQ